MPANSIYDRTDGAERGAAHFTRVVRDNRVDVERDTLRFEFGVRVYAAISHRGPPEFDDVVRVLAEFAP